MQERNLEDSAARARSTLQRRVQQWIARHPAVLLWIIGALTLAALAQVIDVSTGQLRLVVDPSMEALAVDDVATRREAERVRQRFGSSESILVVVHADDVLDADVLRFIDSLSRRLAALPSVAAVESLTATPLPFSQDGTLTFVRVTPEDLAGTGLSDALRARLAQNRLVDDQLVARDRRAAAIVVRPHSNESDPAVAERLAAEVLASVEAERQAGCTVSVTGPPVLRHALGDSVQRQLRRVIPAIAVVLTIMLALAFRSLRGVVLPLATIAIALTWTLALLSAGGASLNLVTALMPPLLVTMGLAYGAHVLSEGEVVAQEGAGLDREGRTLELLRGIGVPVLVTGLTTGIGLLSLSINPQAAVRDFAWLSAVGVGLLVLLSLTFLPASLYYLMPMTAASNAAGRTFDRISTSLGRFDRQWRQPILVVAGVIFVLALVSASRIQVGDAFIGVFAPEARVRVDYDAVNRALGGVLPVEIVIDGPVPRTFVEPNVLAELERLQAWLRRQPEVGAVTGVVDHVTSLAGHVLGPEAAKIPDSADAVGQLLLFGDGELLRTVVNVDRSSTLIRLRLRVDDTASIGAFLSRLEARLAKLPTGLVARPFGEAVRMTESVRDVTAGQLQSILLAIGLIWGCLSLQFMSPKIGLLAAVPTILQSALYFGALGLLGIQLNASTALVECLVLGLAVDDTIHYLSRFNLAAKSSGSERLAADTALRAVFRPVTLTKAILALGFLTMLTGELRNQVQFGWLAALTLFSSWLVDAFFTPAFMSGLRIVTLWDTLRLDLGDDVQGTIPLFAGLSNRQARVFALMANLHTLPAGSRLMAEGDAPGAIYVLIDGEVSVNVERNGRREEVGRLARGAVVGERGYFGQRRSANVDALTTVRLLSFDEHDQQRLLRSYPSIAAHVFLALNRVQASRYAGPGGVPPVPQST